MDDPISTSTVTVLFCDLTASTARLTRLGDNEGDVFRHELFGRLHSCVGESAGKVVKHLGDGLMVVFERSTVGALACARLMHRCVDDLDIDDPVRLRIGISVGEVVEEDGDWFGTPVVEAARLCDLAEPGQTLVPHLLVGLVGSRASAFRFDAVGEVLLKGFSLPLAVVKVNDADSATNGDQESPLVVAAEPQDRARSRRTMAVRGAGALLAIVVAGTFIGVKVGGSSDPKSKSLSSGDSSEQSRSSLLRPKEYKPVLEPAKCGSSSAVASGVKCSELVVPVSRSEPDGPKLRLPVAALEGPAGSTLDPVIVIDFNDPITRTSMNQVADIYVLSIRGFSGEEGKKLQCPAMKATWREALTKSPADPVAIESKVDAARTCAGVLREAGLSLESINLKQVALDIRDLVIALGVNHVSIAAGGYLTPAATAFANSHPDAVSSMILSNPTPPGNSLLAEPVESLASALELLNSRCSQDDECVNSFGDLRAIFDARSQALAANPVHVTTLGLDGAETFDVLLDDRRLASSLKVSLAISERIALVPQAMVDASDDLIAAAGIVDELRTYVTEDSFGPSYLSMTCSYDKLATRLSEIGSRTMQPFSGASDPALPELCSAWNVPSVAEDLSAPLRVGAPVLLIQGGFSLSGVNHWAERMATELTQARLVRFPTLSEDVAYSPPGCLRKLKNEFLERPGAELKTKECEEASPPIDFVGRR